MFHNKGILVKTRARFTLSDIPISCGEMTTEKIGIPVFHLG